MADLGFQNQNIVIAGGFRGIGLELAKLLLAEDANIALLGRNPERGAAAEELLKSLDPIGDLKVIRGDLADPALLADVKGQIDAWLGGKVHHLAVFLGSGKTPPGHDFSLDHWREVFQINTFAPIGVVQAFYPLMLHKEGSPSGCFFIAGMKTVSSNRRLQSLDHPRSDSSTLIAELEMRSN